MKMYLGASGKLYYGKTSAAMSGESVKKIAGLTYSPVDTVRADRRYKRGVRPVSIDWKLIDNINMPSERETIII